MSLLFVLLGCSFFTVDYTPCASHGECRDAFGFGYRCGESQLCEPIEANPRCSDTWPEDLLVRPENYRDHIILGGLYEIAYDEDRYDAWAAELAVRQVDDNAGLDGQQYGIIQCTYEENTSLDSLDMTAAAQEVATWLADDAGAVGVIGPTISSLSAEVYPILAERDVVMMSPSATAVALQYLDPTEVSDSAPGLFWRTAPSDAVQGRAIADDMISRGLGTIAIIYESGPYGEGLAGVVKDYFESDGHTVELYAFASGNSTERDTAITTSCANGGIEEILFVSGSGSDASAFINGASVNSGCTSKSFFLTDAARNTALLDETTGSTSLYDQIRGSAPATPEGDVYDFFNTAYSATFQEDASVGAYTAYAYDAAWLLLYGTAWAYYQEDGLTGTNVARGLRQMSDTVLTETMIQSSNWSLVTSSFKTGAALNVRGASGALDFDPVTEEAPSPVDIWVINTTRDGFDNIERYEY